MSNFYLEFCEVISDLTDDELNWWKQQEKIVVDTMEYEPEKYDQDESICVDMIVMEQKREVLFISDECGEPDRVANIVYSFLKRYRPDDYFSLEWCNHGNDENGGGALFVTINGIEYISTLEWVENKKLAWTHRADQDYPRN